MPDQDLQPSSQDMADYLKYGPSQSPPKTDTGSAASQLLPGVLGMLAPGIGKGLTALAGKGAAALASMGGPLAEFSNLRKLNEFNEMLAKKATPEKAFDATQWFLGPGNHPRFEISDRGLMAKPMPNPMFGVSRGSAEDFIHHPDLFAQYPTARKVRVAVDPGFGKEGEGLYSANPFEITIGGPTGNSLTPIQQSTLLHELGGHYVSNVEGGERGSGSDFVRDHVIDLLKGHRIKLKSMGYQPDDPEIQNINDKINLVSKKAVRMYRGIPGEADARNIVDRFMRQRFGAPPERYPIHYDPDDTSRLFQNRGLWLEPMYMKKYQQNFPSGYLLSMKKDPTKKVLPESMPPGMRSVYDRLPIESGYKNPYMAGEFKYPWKTEDIPRYMQRNWHIPQSYEDIPPDWFEALKQGK